MLKPILIVLVGIGLLTTANAQEEINAPEREKEKPGVQVNLNKEGTTNVRFVSLMQTWVRSGDLNPGSLYREKPKSSLTDISVRRIVFTTIAQLSPRALVLLNLEGSSNSGEGSFQSGLDVGVLDAYGEYKVSNHLFIGAGLHQWTGLSRMNVDGIGSILNLDQPLFQQATWNRLDRLGRVMGIYAKGDIGKFNYRLSVNEPFTPPATAFAANSGKGSPSGGVVDDAARNAQVNVAYMNPAATSKLIQGYFEYAFWEKENHISPYEINTYHGEKKLLNFGTGFFYRGNGIFTPTQIGLSNTSLPESTSNPKVIKAGSESDLFCYAFDATIMLPFSKRADGITAYVAYYHLDLGNNYFTVSPINSITTAGAGISPINGAGNAFPTTGTGNSFYTKLGYIAPKNWFGSSRLGIFGTYQNSTLQALKEAVQVYEAGINWFVNTNKVKLTVLYRDRPIYRGAAAFENVASTAVVDQRKGEFITQLQFNF
jgi:hypothetical protein